MWNFLNSLATCLCDTLAAEGLPEPCFCGIVPGASSAALYMGGCEEPNGMAWVRYSSAYPANGVGVVSTETNNCGAALGLDLEVGVMRVVPILGDDQGNPPTDKELLEATALQTADMLAMRKAILCCAEVNDVDMILQTYTPLGPEGGMVGGSWMLAALTYG